MKKLILTIVVIGMLAGGVTPVHAVDLASEAGASARPSFATLKADDRASRLKAYLTELDSPLANYADHFVSEADRLNLDWKLVAAIAGVESTFGKHIPTNSYNGWGWGVFTGEQDGIHFNGWKDGITKVSEGLRYNYVDRGAQTIEEMGRIYAASPVWSYKVHFFLNKIESFTPRGAAALAVTL